MILEALRAIRRTILGAGSGPAAAAAVAIGPPLPIRFAVVNRRATKQAVAMIRTPRRMEGPAAASETNVELCPYRYLAHHSTA